MDSKTFWMYVENTRQKELGKQKVRVASYRASNDAADLCGQPEDGKSIFIVSRELLGVMDAGAVVETNYRLAGQRIAEGSHAIATADQIAAWRLVQQESAEVINTLNSRASRIAGQVVLAPMAPLQPRVK